MSKKLIVGLVILQSIVIVGVIAAILLGYMYIGTKNPVQKAVTQWQVCGKDMVNAYNKSFTGSSNEALKNSLKDLSDKVAKKDSYEKDATCNYIVLSYYIRTDDTAKVNEAYTRFTKSIDGGSFISPELVDLRSMTQIQTTVDIYNYEHTHEKNPDEPNG